MMLCAKTVFLVVLLALFTSAWPLKRRMGNFAHMLGKRFEPKGAFIDDTFPDVKGYGPQRGPEGLSIEELASRLKDEDDALLGYLSDLISRRNELDNLHDRDDFDV